jgi:RHS repeat-associated protein
MPRDGRESRRTLENWVNSAVNETFVLPNATYDALGNVTSLAYPQCTHAACSAPSPRTVTFSYSDDLLSAVGIPGNAGYYASSLTYYPNLMVSQVVHTNNPADSTKSLTDTYANDPFEMRRPASVTTTTPASAVRWSTGAYAYDGAGNVKTIGTHTFTYDKVSRLTASNQYLEPTASTTLRTQTFTYDAYGNLLTFGGSSARNTPTAPQTNHLTGATYDASGNVTAWNGNTYTYDPFHLMWDYKTSTDEWAYLYTADDERAWSYKTDNTSLWTLRGLDGKVLREYSTAPSWNVAEDYIYRSGLLLAAETPAGTRHFHLDHLGSPRLVSNNLGQQAAYHVYYPYGEEATAFNQDTIREKFTGHERDLGNPGGSGDDLDYMHARHESEWMGRFLSIDPSKKSEDPASPKSWNRYAYSLDSPLNFVDPDGMVVSCPPEGCPHWLTNPTTVGEKLQKGFYEASILPGPMAMAAGPEAGGGFFGSLLSKAGQLLGRIFGGASEGAAGATAASFSRALTVADLGVQGSISELKGTFSVAEGSATVRVEMIDASVKNPLSIINNLVQLAEKNGATTLRIEGTIGNPKLLSALAQRYGMQTTGATDFIIIKLRPPV